MKRFYHRPEWRKFREEIIAHDEGRCQRCYRSEENGAILQVHHRIYHPGLPLWEYPPSECETLCKRCHAEEHGRIRPSSGWSFAAEEDLGGLTGECEACGTSIRYKFHIEHPRWFPMIVGTDCCDGLTGSEIATQSRRRNDRLLRFLASPQWETTPRGLQIRRMKIDFFIERDGAEFLIVCMRKRGKRRFSSSDGAKIGIFNFIESGEVAKFYKKHRTI